MQNHTDLGSAFLVFWNWLFASHDAERPEVLLPQSVNLQTNSRKKKRKRRRRRVGQAISFWCCRVGSLGFGRWSMRKKIESTMIPITLDRTGGVVISFAKCELQAEKAWPWPWQGRHSLAFLGLRCRLVGTQEHVPCKCFAFAFWCSSLFFFFPFLGRMLFSSWNVKDLSTGGGHGLLLVCKRWGSAFGWLHEEVSLMSLAEFRLDLVLCKKFKIASNSSRPATAFGSLWTSSLHVY